MVAAGLSGICVAQDMQGPTKYWAYFKDKKDTLPEADWISQKARRRRARHNFPAATYADAPVHPKYVTQVAERADSMGHASRWLNAVAFWGDSHIAGQVSALPGVRRVAAMPRLASGPASMPATDASGSLAVDRLRAYQVGRLQIDSFRKAGLDGRDVTIAIFDAGFKGAQKTPALRHLWEENRILRLRDFVGRDSNVFFPSAHGTMVLSCIGGREDTSAYGLAPEARFMLARTERYLWEVASEEDHWIAALEWAERHGADLVNSSLGYTTPRYRRSDMNGRVSPVSRAAGLSARRGLLVINSAGNDGDGNWRYIAAPADEDSVLSVGATAPKTDLRAPFSSVGPNAMGELAPRVCAPGIVAGASGQDPVKVQGTSFSAPLVTGFAACLLQRKPALRAMELFEIIQKSGHLHPYYDYELGHGVPQASRALQLLAPETKPQINPTFRSSVEQSRLQIELERSVYQKRLRDGEPQHVYVFYHVARANGTLKAYRLLRNPQQEIIIHLEPLDETDLIRVHYEGYTLELPMDEVIRN